MNKQMKLTIITHTNNMLAAAESDLMGALAGLNDLELRHPHAADLCRELNKYETTISRLASHARNFDRLRRIIREEYPDS